MISVVTIKVTLCTLRLYLDGGNKWWFNYFPSLLLMAYSRMINGSDRGLGEVRGREIWAHR